MQNILLWVYVCSQYILLVHKELACRMLGRELEVIVAMRRLISRREWEWPVTVSEGELGEYY